MFRSLANRSLPKSLAIAVSMLLGVAFVPLGALPASAAGDADIFVYDQCYTGDPPVGGQACEGWTNGILNDSNSDYNEDEVTPQRLVLDFNEAGTHTIDISYLTFDHNVHAYDSLATWNHTRTGAARCQGIDASDCVADAAPSTFPIPLDATSHHDVGVGKSATVSNHQLAGQVLTMYGGELTGAAYRGMGTYSPDYQTLRVTLTAAANSKVMLLFGGHIAATFGPRGWGEKADGTNLGAAGVPGGSYHIRITEVNGKSPGNRDNQLMSSAIEPPSETAIATQATGQVTIGASITDTATVTPSNAVGTVNFSVFGPNNSTCSGTPVFTSNNRPVTSGTATSAAFTPTAVGTYRWIASFTPTDPTKFDAVSGVCNAANESSVVVKRQPAISTDSQDSATLPNASISDSATVTNLTSDATGTVTFNLYAPGDTTCATSIWSNQKPLGTVTSNSATVTSDSHPVAVAGTYRWIAAYSGDAKNESVSGQCNDPSESTVVNKAPATITTDAQDTAKLPDATITDTATLTGVTSNAGGEIIFKLYGPDATPLTPTCTEGDGGNLVFTSTVGDFPVNGPNTYGPVSVEVDKAGVYFWVATYTGDTNNLSVSGVCGDPTEKSDVGKASPTISTSATDGTLPGASIHDVATVKGLTDDATGTVAFSLWNNATCTGVPVFTDTKPLGAVTSHQASATSASFTVVNAGAYNWVASYSGDANNDSKTGACGDEGETSTVNPATPSISTAATNAQLPAGTIHDVATVSGLTSNATGTVTFRLWNNANCSGGTVFSDTKPLGTVTAGVAIVTSANYTPTAAGNYYWIASYSGDNNNVTVTGHCGDAGETSTVTKTAPSITTLADASATLPAGTLSDTASLSGLTTNATGTVIFRLYGPDATPGSPTCDQGSLAYSSSPPVPIVNNGNGTATAESPDFTPSLAGTYFWIASYSGDANNADVSGACGDANETSVVNRAVTTIATTATNAQLPAGTIHDVATVGGLTANATGTVRFDLWNNPTCVGSPVFTNTQPLGAVSGGLASATSANFTPTAAGSYYWIAFYSGDGGNLAKQGTCGDAGETSTVTKASPQIATVADVSAPLPGGTLFDTASLSGLTTGATGTVTFRLYGPDTTPIIPTCDVGTLAFTSTVPIVNNGNGTASAESDEFTVSKAGTYFWIATYNGDANNDTATGACGDANETSVVDKASPTISTSATDSTLPGASIHDVATVKGLTSDATGTVAFSLWANANCSGEPVFTDSKPLGTVTAGRADVTSDSFTVTDAGDYNWIASYSGDANNDDVTGECGDEGETSTVNPATPSISTAATNAQLPAGTIHDVATVSGLTSNATGTVTFRLWNNANCDGGTVFNETKPLGTVTAGVAIVTSANYTPTAAGNYYWIASYSGDNNNVTVAGHCGDAGETSTVTKATTTISTAATNAQLPAGTIHDVATVSGLTTDATGTVTFDLYDNDECTGDTVFSDTKPLGAVTGGVASATSANFTPTAVGDYYWIASYSGDANNLASEGDCGDEGETSTVIKADTTIITDAADEAPSTQDGTGVVLTDTATLSGATENAGGDITFTLYGPFDSLEDVSCEGEGTTVGEPVSVDGNGAYESDPVTVTEFGFYTWVASYSGDANNEPADHACGLPAETVEFQPTLEKTADPASGGVVQPDGSIEYTVTVGNTGDIAINDAKVTDTLPPFVTVDEDSISDGGVFAAGSDASVSAGTITWSVDLAAAGDEGDTVELTYEVTVDEDAPEGAVLVNRAVLFSLEDTTTHVVPTGDLTIVKEVSPVAGNGVVVHFGDTLTYTLNAVASGDLDQPDVVVTDYVPGFDPLRPSSGKTTYVAGSAVCVGAGDCTVTEPGADGLITWELGDMAAGTSRQVTFKVTIDRPAALPDGGIPAVDVLNAGAVESARTPYTPSNEVVTPVTEVLGVKIPNTPVAPLPRTGLLVPPAQIAGLAVLMVGLGLLLLAATRRRGRHRRA